jgi:NTE family protein
MTERDAGGPRLGLALGSGSAKGWAHIGVIQELENLGFKPEVVCGTSIGALVGAVYVSGQLDSFSKWVQSLTTRDVFGLMDFSFSGGVVKGEKLFEFFQKQHQNPDISELDKQFAAVATDMHNGRETWLNEGPVLSAARASCALPGLFSPVKHNGRWMLDGGLVNPVPVSVCRALGADVVLAVNLNHLPMGAHMSRQNQRDMRDQKPHGEDEGFWQKVMDFMSSNDGDDPGFFDVVAASINIMQDRITRSRMAGDPAEVTLTPILSDFAMMDFHRAKEGIEEGRRLVRNSRKDIEKWLGEATERPADEKSDDDAGEP